MFMCACVCLCAHLRVYPELSDGCIPPFVWLLYLSLFILIYFLWFFVLFNCCLDIYEAITLKRNPHSGAVPFAGAPFLAFTLAFSCFKKNC